MPRVTTGFAPGEGIWTRAPQGAAEWPARWDGAVVGDGISLEIWLGPRTTAGARYFRCYLTTELGRPLDPVATGLIHVGPFPATNWVDVVEFNNIARFEDGRSFGIPPGIEKNIFQRFAEAVPPGGHLMVEYDSPNRAVTAHALAAKAPPLATPLGYLIWLVGCGDAFHNWYTPEGGREGARKLQGFRALDEAHARQRGMEMLAELQRFMDGAADLEWDVQAQTRPLAEAAIEELSARFA